MGSTIRGSLKNLGNRLSKVLEDIGLNDRASVAAVVYFILVLMLSLFVWIGLGSVVDRMSVLGAGTGLDPALYPVSQNRVDTLNMLGNAYQGIPWLGGIFPMLIYTLVVAKRRMSGQVA